MAASKRNTIELYEKLEYGGGKDSDPVG